MDNQDNDLSISLPPEEPKPLVSLYDAALRCIQDRGYSRGVAEAMVVARQKELEIEAQRVLPMVELNGRLLADQMRRWY